MHWQETAAATSDNSNNNIFTPPSNAVNGNNKDSGSSNFVSSVNGRPVCFTYDFFHILDWIKNVVRIANRILVHVQDIVATMLGYASSFYSKGFTVEKNRLIWVNLLVCFFS
jgi:hypothetical protein